MQTKFHFANIFLASSFFIVNVFSFFVLRYTLPVMKEKRFRVFFWILALVIIFSFIIARMAGIYMYGFSVLWIKVILYVAAFWNVTQFVIIVLSPLYFWIEYSKRKSHELSDKQKKHQKELVSRRRFLGLMTYGVTLGASGITLQGMYESKMLVVNKRITPLKNLPHSLNGFKIAQISDVHLGSFISLDWFDKVCHAIELEEPDMVVVTGDLSDDINLLFPALDRLEDLQEKTAYDVYFCMGNHEYFMDINKVEKIFKKSSICVLRNEALLVKDAPVPFYLAGVDYPFAKNYEDKIKERKDFMSRAFSEVPNDAFSILIAHHPDFIDNAFEARIPLTLTGHTHGGQVGLGERSLIGMVGLGYKYMRGWYENKNCLAYVHSGTGHWLPFRLNCPPEVTVFTLKPA